MSEKRPAPWRGRPRTDDPRNAWIHVRCTQSEYATLSAGAERAGLWLGPYLLRLALGAKPLRSRPRPDIDLQVMGRVLGLIGNVASNVNQLARGYNAAGDLAAVAVLDAILVELRAMSEVQMAAIDGGKGN